MSKPTRSHPEHTADGRYIVVEGRRWRATDPDIPEESAARLRSHLMAARRGVAAALRKRDTVAERAARARVHRAKVALGERGEPWWEQSATDRTARWRDGLEALDADSDSGSGRGSGSSGSGSDSGAADA
ncbi:hypothetical protein ABZ567_29260 [Streptomyces sp. NPDC016459]|uniref:hypothetical protein n=1 Tax=Streptomyces sp. NPDC016459 TaxID=3157190 RepID=UPI0033BFDFB6